LGKLLELARSRPLLQVAIDLTSIGRAMAVALEASRAGAHVIEVGTPLIKVWGAAAVEAVSQGVGERSVVLADTKTADAARVELEPLIRAGASAVTVLGLCSPEIIEEALSIASEMGADLVVDLIHVDNPVDRALKLAELGARVFELHVGVDVQKRRGLDARALLSEVEELSRSGIVVAVAGGIKPSNAGEFVARGARIVVIGGAIYRAENPFEATRRALESIEAAASR